MTDNTSPNRTKARLMALLMLVFFSLRFMGLSLTEDAPVASAAEAPTAAPTQTTSKIFVRAEWLAHCNPAWPHLGLYTATDAPCQPSALAPLTQFQSLLASNGLLTPDEYLSPTPATLSAQCNFAVLNSAGQAAGYICADANGFYRADVSGADPAKRVQLQGAGN